MTDTEKIVEIRETVTCFMGAGNDAEYDRALNTLKENAGEWIPFLLSELERLEREYTEERAAHVAELLEKEAKLNQAVEALEVTTYHIQELWKLIPNENFINEMYRLNQALEALEELHGFSTLLASQIRRFKGGESDE